VPGFDETARQVQRCSLEENQSGTIVGDGSLLKEETLLPVLFMFNK
jgi:hypothetical protein